MPVRCAACLAPMPPGMKRVVADTEVFHETCVALIAQSLGNKMRRRIIELNARLATARNEADEVARLRTAISDANREASEIRAEADRLRIRVRELHDAGRNASSSGDYFRARVAEVIEDRDRLAQENERLARQLEAARTEVALHQTIQTGQEQKAQAVTRGDPAPPQSDMWSDMEKRFSLLEIDDKK